MRGDRYAGWQSGDWTDDPSESPPGDWPRPSLVEFLTARLTHDVSLARQVQAQAVSDGLDPDDLTFPALALAARVLREVEAKRAIVESVDVLTGGDKTYLERLKHSDSEDSRYVIARDILRHLAAIYSGHPSYNESWKP